MRVFSFSTSIPLSIPLSFFSYFPSVRSCVCLALFIVLFCLLHLLLLLPSFLFLLPSSSALASFSYHLFLLYWSACLLSFFALRYLASAFTANFSVLASTAPETLPRRQTLSYH